MSPERANVGTTSENSGMAAQGQWLGLGRLLDDEELIPDLGQSATMRQPV